MRPFHALGEVLVASLIGVVSALGWLATRPFVAIQRLRELRVELWIVEGTERSSRLPLSILCSALCSASGEDKNYLLDVIFGDSYHQRRLGRFWLWNVAKAIPSATSGCSMIVTEIFERQLKFTRSPDCFFFPAWVLGEVDLPLDARATDKVSGDLRRIRRHGLQAEITRDPAQLDDFYYNMLVPYGTNRFGVCADLAPYARLKKAFPSCDLLLIKNQQRSIAGQLILYKGEHPQLWEMGIRDGNGDYVKDGAGCALYHFGLQHLQGKGYKKARLGWSRPFLRNGVLQYKRKWSQKITISANYGFAFNILSHTPSTKAFLCSNPFIFRRGGLFYGAVFVDGQKPLSTEDIRQIDRDYYHPGLSRMFIYCLGQSRAQTPNPIPPELAEHIELADANH